MENKDYPKNVVSLRRSEEAESGFGGDRPLRNTLTGCTGKGGSQYPPIPFFYYSCLCLKNAWLRRSKKQKNRVNILQKNKVKNQVLTPKKGQHISGQDNITAV